MITVEKLEKGTYFDDAFKISFRYDPITVAKVKELAERRYLPEDRAWEIPAHELPALIEKVGLSNIKSEEAVVQALNTKEIEDKREATQKRLKGIKPVRDFDFKTAPLPHQIEAFNYGMEKNSLLIGDEQGLGKTKESIDICVARKKELIKTLKENELQRKAFELYYGLGDKRSLRAVAETIGRTERTVAGWSRAFNWVARVTQRNIENAQNSNEAKITAELTDVRTKYRILINNLMADFSKDIAQGKVKVKNINDFERLVKLDMLLMGEATERVERGGTQELSQDAKDRLDEIAQLMKRAKK